LGKVPTGVALRVPPKGQAIVVKNEHHNEHAESKTTIRDAKDFISGIHVDSASQKI
jgi:hypothetical protein